MASTVTHQQSTSGHYGSSVTTEICHLVKAMINKSKAMINKSNYIIFLVYTQYIYKNDFCRLGEIIVQLVCRCLSEVMSYKTADNIFRS